MKSVRGFRDNRPDNLRSPAVFRDKGHVSNLARPTTRHHERSDVGSVFSYGFALVVIIRLSLPHVALAQVIHTPNDHVPDFVASPTIRSAQSGAWSSPTTWTPARLPVPSDIVSVEHSVIYDSTTGDGNNFRVYFRQQANQNLYGGLAPCSKTTTRPEIDGITCPMTGIPPGGPSAPTGIRIQH
jgi:hypothetical protein